MTAQRPPRARFALAAALAIAVPCALAACAADPNATTATGAGGTAGGTGAAGGNVGGTGGTPGTGGTSGTSGTTGGTTTPAAKCTGRLECRPQITLANAVTGNVYKNGVVSIVSAGELTPGAELTFAFSVRNAGNAALQLSKVELAYSGASEAETAGGPAFRCLGADKTTACKDFKFPAVAGAGQTGPAETGFEVRFKKYDDSVTRQAVLHIFSNDKSDDTTANHFIVTFTTAAGIAKVKVAPTELDFAFVAVGKERTEKLKILNTGSADLVVSQIDLTTLEKDLFTFVLDGKESPAGAMLAHDPPLVIKPSAGRDVLLLYRAKDDKPHVGDIVLHTNDPGLQSEGGPGWKRIKVKVNTTGPCLLANPKHLVFGASAVGQSKQVSLSLKSCGDQVVEIASATFDKDDPTTKTGYSPDFTIDWSKVSETGGKAPTADAPFKIGLNGEAKLAIAYTPAKLSVVQGGQPVPDLGRLLLKSNTAAGETRVTMEGVGASGDCPTSVIVVQEGDAVLPQTTLHLDGKQSYASSGAAITAWKWTVIQPKGSVALFQPTSNAPTVTFQPNVAGDYKFTLETTDLAGKKSCFPAEKVVKVLPDQAIHVELVWSTPGDKDETDEGPAAGSDLDLHFAHMYASNPDYDKDGKADPWFADIYDCFWFNKKPKWGSYDPNKDDDPSLDRDDTDGAGPENLNLTEPEEGKEYAIGVHYYNDFSKGPSKATVRVYVFGQKVFEVASPNLVKGDLWYVATVAWGSDPEVIAKTKSGKPNPNDFFVTPKYPHPVL
ncbi:MAG: hypothetical protein EXR79_02940 [Myxococcales bacterium]|nr:hypothetical protein [Myxococcales bacterium]